MTFALWMTGLPCSGKTTIAKRLIKSIPNLAVLDGDELREWLSPKDFSREGRNEHNKKVAYLTKLLISHKVPVCVFVAIGADIIHQHPSFDASLTGEGSLRDFRLLVENICRLNDGGVVLNFGSAVILPEVFLKALNLARNFGYKVKNFTTANFDMIYHYRPWQNVVSRPVEAGGKGYYIVGHHEIMLPLLAQSVIEKI